ncbi:hypothetical protein AB0I60_06295 [Actinosynnema sp. NPDC050436]|uniref:hypothetical protein n=1 Tax=Actinosynnema sp. NPDC050436 TaxID=3155659 RepID=UPI0033DD1CCF
MGEEERDEVPVRGPADRDDEGRLPGDGDVPFGWRGSRPFRSSLRREFRWACAVTAGGAAVGVAHPLAGLFLVLGMLPVVIPLGLGVRNRGRGVVRVDVEPGAPRRITLVRADGRTDTRSLDDVVALRSLLLGYSGGETNGWFVVEIRFRRRRYRTTATDPLPGHAPADLMAALRRARPTAEVLPFRDKRHLLTPD